MRRPPLTLFLALAACASPDRAPPDALRQAASDEPCTFPTPEGWVEAPPGPTGRYRVEEAFARENIVVKSFMEVRDGKGASVAEGVRAARAEEEFALGDRPDFELVRDHPLPGARLPAHLLVYRYRVTPDSRVILRFRVVYGTGFRVVHLAAESQATGIDALHTPYREAGLHEMWMRPAMQAFSCTR